MFWHVMDFIGGAVLGWFILDALRGLKKLGDAAERIAQAFEDFVDLHTPDEDDEQDEEAVAPAAPSEAEQEAEADAFAQYVIEQLRRARQNPPPIPEDAR